MSNAQVCGVSPRSACRKRWLMGGLAYGRLLEGVRAIALVMPDDESRQTSQSEQADG